MRTTFSCLISGLYYHAKHISSGSYSGYIKPNNNAYDPDAIAIFLSDTNELIGYIPKEITGLVRLWTPGFSCLKCKISLEILPDMDIYRGSVEIFDESKPNENSPYYGKKIYCCKTKNLNLCSLVESFGCVINRTLKKDTDYVVHLDGITDLVKDRQERETFHFEAIHLYDFLSAALPAEEKDDRFYGKEVAFASKRASPYADLVAEYLIVHGAKLRPNYRKATTDIIIGWDKWANKQTLEKAKEQGKGILMASEILPFDNEREVGGNRDSCSTNHSAPLLQAKEANSHYYDGSMVRHIPSHFSPDEKCPQESSAMITDKKSTGCAPIFLFFSVLIILTCISLIPG